MKRHPLTVAALLAVAVVAQPAAGQAPAGEILPKAVPPAETLSTSAFICTDGSIVEMGAQPAAGVMRVTRLGQAYVLFAAAGVDPPRYVAREGTLILEGDTAYVTAPGRQPIRCGLRPQSPVAGVLWGTITTRAPSALPRGAVAKVLLVDAARPDAPAVEVASTEIRTLSNQMPLSFIIRYDPNRILSPGAGRYRLTARVQDAQGHLLLADGPVRPALFAEGLQQAPVELELVPPSPSK